MTYSVGNVILASDFNGFCGPTASGGTANANLNDIWGTGSGDKGWGETAVSTVSTGGTVTATNWASLVNNISSAGSQTNTTITSRSAPTAGSVVSILANVNADLTSVTTNRGNAVASGTEYGTFTGNTSVTAATGSGQATWTLTFTHTVTFPSANAARYFWNAGGLVRIQYGKSSTGTDIDADWNTFAGQCGSIYISGRVANAAQTIAGTSYTGTTRVSGTGGTQTTLATTTGWYQLTAGGAATTLFQLNNAASPYTGEYIKTTAAVDAGSSVLTLVTTWFQPAVTGAGQTCNISGGTATTSPSTTITGTAPTTLVTYRPPSSTYLTSASWGTPTITAGVASSVFSADYLVVAGGGAGGGSDSSNYSGGGGGAGGLLTGTDSFALNTAYTVTVGGGGSANGGTGSNSVLGSYTALGGGGGGSNGNGGSGGSGGGASGPFGGSGSGGSGTPGQGNPGGNKAPSGSNGGGGGASAAGTTSGGDGSYVSWATAYGSPGGYFGGGGAGAAQGNAGGLGGGGAAPGNSAGSPGTTNTGGGGGGGHNNPSGGNGGSGIVMIRIPSTRTATFSAGVTQSSSTSGGFTTIAITATTNTSQTVTFT